MLKVLGYGDNVIDKYENLKRMYPGGNALNFAVYASKLKHDASFLSVFSDDAMSKLILESIRNIGLNIERCRYYSGYECGYSRVTFIENDRVFIGSNEGGVLREVGIELLQEDLDYIKNFDLVHTGYWSYTIDQLHKIKEIGVKVSFDFSDEFTDMDVKNISKNISYGFFSTADYTDDEVKTLLKTAIDNGCELAGATRGDKPVIIYDGNDFYKHYPKKIEIVDTMGAGDAFITSFIIGYIESDKKPDSIKQCLKDASNFAGKICLLEGSFGFGKDY